MTYEILKCFVLSWLSFIIKGMMFIDTSFSSHGLTVFHAFIYLFIEIVSVVRNFTEVTSKNVAIL